MKSIFWPLFICGNSVSCLSLLKFYLPTKIVMFADKKSQPTKDCGLSSLIAPSDFILLALHIKKISI
jgi:hypothetical protein